MLFPLFKTAMGSRPFNRLLQTGLCLLSCTHGAYQNIVGFLQGVTKLKIELRWIFGTVSQLSLSKQFCYTAQLWKVRGFCCLTSPMQLEGFPPAPSTSTRISSSVTGALPVGFVAWISPSFCWHRLIQIWKYGRKGVTWPACPEVELRISAHETVGIVGPSVITHLWIIP